MAVETMTGSEYLRARGWFTVGRGDDEFWWAKLGVTTVSVSLPKALDIQTERDELDDACHRFARAHRKAPGTCPVDGCYENG
jgi:hypothetical protein